MQSLIDAIMTCCAYLLVCTAHAAVLVTIAMMFGGTLTLAAIRYRKGFVPLRTTL